MAKFRYIIPSNLIGCKIGVSCQGKSGGSFLLDELTSHEDLEYLYEQCNYTDIIRVPIKEDVKVKKGKAK